MPTKRQEYIAKITRHYPLYSGCGTLSNHRIFQKIVGQSTETAWAKVPGGYWAAAPLADHVGRSIFYFGELDPKITWVCSRLVKPGDHVLDIGANLGLVSLTLSSIVGPTGKVHSFEPNPLMQSMVNEAIERNGLTNLKLHPIALGSHPGELTLSVPRHNAGSASLVANRRSLDSVDVVVPVRTLSSVMEEEDHHSIRLVKIDVEGFEPEVLAGATDFIARQPPDIILFELNDQSEDLNEHPTIVTLSRLGYGFLSLPKRLTRMLAKKLDPATNSTPEGNDFIAARLGAVYSDVAERLGAI